MSKKLLALVLSLMLLIAMTVMGAAATEETPAPETHSHCVCGGAPTAAAANHVCADVTWTPISEALTAAGQTASTVNFGKLPSGNYYLDSDLVVTAATAADGKDIALCLNGKSITTTTGTVFGYGAKNGSYTITDCSYNAGRNVWSGTIYGGTYMYGGIMYTGPKMTVNIYGGNYAPKSSSQTVVRGGLFTLGQDADQTAAAKAVLNIYNGRITGSKATGVSGTTQGMAGGGAIAVYHSCDFNMYGGTITGGSAGVGGNIYLSTKGEATIYGGTISNGVSSAGKPAALTNAANWPQMGGGIYVVGNGTLTIKGGTFVGNAAFYGGAIAANASSQGGSVTVNIEGGKFYSGTAYSNSDSNRAYHQGGTVYIVGNGGTATLNIKEGADIGYGHLTNTTFNSNIEASGGNIYAKNATVNMTGGKVIAGKAVQGGNFFIADGGSTYEYPLTISGGTVSGGQAVHTGYPTAKNGTALVYPIGGNISVNGNEKVIIQGGTIENGTASHAGGNIGVNGTADLEVSGGKILGGTAAYAGNIFTSNNAAVVVTVSGGEITGGTLDTTKAKGNGACFRLNPNVQLMLEGTPKITEIYMVGSNPFDATKLGDLGTPIAILPQTVPTVFALVSEDISDSFTYAAGTIGYTSGSGSDDSLDVPVEGDEGSVDVEVEPAQKALYLIKEVEAEAFDVTLQAGQSAYYAVVNGKGATLTIEDADAYVVYNEVTYAADENGVVTVLLGKEDAAQIQVGNTATEKKALTLNFEAAPAVEKFSVKFARLNLANEINMQFAFEQGELDWTGAYAEIEKDYVGYDTVTQTVALEDWFAVDINGVAHHVVSFSGIAAKEMGDEIRVTIYNAEGEAISEVWTDSVLSYIVRNIDSVSALEQKLYVDMLNYGAAAQTFFDYDADDLVVDALTDAQKALASTSVTTENNQVQGANHLGTRLTLVSRIELQFAFANIDDTMHAEYSFTDHYGDSYTVTVEGSEFVYEDGVWIVVVNQQVLADAREEVTLKVYDAQNHEVASVVDSVESYVHRNAGNESMSEVERTLHQKIMMFANSAYEFFHV